MCTVGEVWLNAAVALKKQIQTAFFPDGILISPEGFEAPITTNFFLDLEATKKGKI
jgi:hypothetical protein